MQVRSESRSLIEQSIKSVGGQPPRFFLLPANHHPPCRKLPAQSGRLNQGSMKASSLFSGIHYRPAAHGPPCQSQQSGNQRAQQIEKGIGRKQMRPDLQCSQHRSATCIPWNQRRRHGASVFQTPRKAPWIQSSPCICLSIHPAGKNNREILVCRNQIDSKRRRQRGQHQSPTGSSSPKDSLYDDP